MIDPSSLITPNPWPATLTPEQVTDAQAAIEGYRDYWKMVDVAIAQPTQDWTEQVQQHTDGPAQVALMETLGRLVERGRYASGTTSVNPVVVDVQPGLVVISDCVDKTATDILDPTGKSVKAPDAPGTYFRHQASANMIETIDGRWVLALGTDDWSQTC